MAGKYDLTMQLMVQTAKGITRNGESYLAFLTTAAHNFKYNFRDQLLIYAQKSDATACAEIGFWNRHGRWVNRGTKGIALLTDSNGPYKLRYVFDQSDTNSRTSKQIPVWRMQPQYENAVIETLENRYGELADKSTLAAGLLATAKNIAEDNCTDYLAQLHTAKTGSLLEELDEDNTAAWFKSLLENSIGYMLLTRCGQDTSEYLETGDFARIGDFNTLETISILGAAASDISEMALREIATTVLTQQKAERQQRDSVAMQPQKAYAGGTKENAERSNEDGTDLPARGRLPAAQPDRSRNADAGQVRDAAAVIPAGQPQRDLHRDDAGRQAAPAPAGDRPAGDRNDGTADNTDGAAAGRGRETESGGSDEVGGPDEQHPGIGGGDRAGGTDLQLTPSTSKPQAKDFVIETGPTGLQILHHDFNTYRSLIDYYIEDDEKNELLRTSDALKEHRKEIAAFFADHTDSRERGDFIKGFFNNTYVESILQSGQRAGYRAWDDVLTLWRGSYPTREKEVFLRWWSVANAIYGMILLHKWLDPDEYTLFSEAEQIALIEQTEAEKASAFSLPQEAIDYILCSGSGVSESKFRIYAQYQENADKQENIKFLKREYGDGGRSDAIPGSGIWEDHDSKGILLRRRLGGDKNDEVFLSWVKVEKRIRELVALDRYLNRAEKEQYPTYLIQIQEQAERWKVVKEYRSIIDDYLDFKTQLGEQKHSRMVWLARRCSDCFGTGEKKSHVLTMDGDFALPIMREAMQIIIGDNTHLTERCNAMLAILNGSMAASMEPTYEELHPPKREYRFALGDTVYLGAQEYQMLAFDEQTVRLFDPSFPLLNKELGRVEFDRMLAENPLNDRLLQIVEIEVVAEAENEVKGETDIQAEEQTDKPKYDLGYAHLGNGVTVWNRLEMEDGDYKTIAHITPERTVTFYEDDLPEDVRAQIEEIAATSTMTISYTQNTPVFSVSPLVREADTISADAKEQSTPPQDNAAMARAKQLINEYCQDEFGQDADFSDLTQVDLAFSTVGDTEHDAEVYADLLHYRLVYLVDRKEIAAHQCHDLVELNEYLTNLEFDGMIAYAEEQYEQQQEPESEFDDFSDIDSSAVRAALAEHGIVDGQVVDPEKLAASPVIQQATAIVEQIAANAPPPYERFSLIETGNGYAVWDDIRHEVYVDSEGIQEEFPSERQAEDYLKQVKKAVADKEAAEWLAVERAKQEPEPVKQAEKEITLPPPAPKPRGKVSPFVLHPEIPDKDRQEYRITDDAIGTGTPGERFNNNVRAIRLLKKLESEDRFATPEEQAVLAQYVGWGGLSECFEERHSKYAELKALLTEDEYAAARESTLTAFYTPPLVIRSIYQALENMGFQTGNVLEPSCGIGNFIGMRPDALAETKIYGIELDSISGRIARQLYQKSSIAVQGFEKTDLPDSFFDAAIGNVPFGNFKIPDKRYDKHNFLIHDYFFGRTLDKVRPGGIIAFVTSKGTMDKENPNVRRYIAQRADLLGAIRLPNNTFKAAAGTEVTSDILFLQKRDSLSCTEPDWVHLNTDENGLKMNQYFIDHPDMVMGEMKEISGPFGPETACLPREGQNLDELLAAAIQNIHGQITEYTLDDPENTEADRSIPADPSVRNFSYTIVDGSVYFRENSRMNPVELSVTAANRVKGLIDIRDCVRLLIEYQTENYPDDAILSEQRKLNALYDAFVEKYGRINARANKSAFAQDGSYFLLSSLEILDDEQQFVRKADMFTKRTIRHKEVVQSVDTASEALAVSLAEKACVDLGYMASLMGGSEKILEIVEDLQGVIFKDPDSGPFDINGDGVSWYKGWQTADEYLSGNVRKKLETAKTATESDPMFQINMEALEKVQPVDLTPGEISVRLGATWIPPADIAQFIFELFETPPYMRWRIHVHYSKHTGVWNVEGKSYDKANFKTNNVYGTLRINGYKIVEETLNLRDVRIFDIIVDETGKKSAVLNKKETAIAQGKQELIKQAFQDWIWRDPKRRERLVRFYNDTFNSIRPREYDGQHIRFYGMNPEITLRPHQSNAIAHILYGGNALLAHVVGAGKTFEMVAAAQESKRLGLCQKSLFVVPNHLTEQWATEYLQLYPSANILVATKKDFEAKNRKRFCGRIATGDYDAIIIGHSQFEKIPMSREWQITILRQQKAEIMKGIAELKERRGERFSTKQMEKSKKAIEAKLERLNDQSRKDDVVTFEELGIDRLFVDEAHYYKNLAAFSKMRNVGGISQTEAQKSSDLYMKCRYLDELTDGRGVVFATGTPISNTMVEMYTMQKYLQYGTLQRNGLLHFDSWASTFGETVTAIELAPEGTGYRSKTRFSRFYNLPELMAMFKEVADIQTADMLNLPVPKANYHNVVLQPSEQQKEMVAALGERAERVRNKMVKSTVDNMLLITNDGRKLALDQRLTNPLLPDSETGKVNACAENVFDIWQRTADQRFTQMVFCDLSTPKGNDEFNVYDDLRDKLIAKGIPAGEIAYIHTANSEAQKKELFGKVRSGQIRVLLGSTQKMGAGTNVQNKLIALHHIDCPWRPSDLQQREGRIIRQGNSNPEVEIYTYVTEKTFDSYLYQMVEGKQKFIGQVMTSKSPVRSAEDVDETALSYAEVKALCSGNPQIKEKMDLDVAVQRLKLLKANHLSQRYALEDKIIKEFPQKIASYEQRIAGYTEDMARLLESTHPNEDGFSPMVVEDVTYTDKKAAGSAILAACKAMTSPDPVLIGQYRGFAMSLRFDSFNKEFEAELKGTLQHIARLGTDILGNIQRLDNLLGGFEEKRTACQAQLESAKLQMESAKKEVERPFPQEEELKQKSARLDELNISLNLDKRDNEIVDGERDEESEPPVRREPDRGYEL